jgi:hypothetical protein
MDIRGYLQDEVFIHVKKRTNILFIVFIETSCCWRLQCSTSIAVAPERVWPT